MFERTRRPTRSTRRSTAREGDRPQDDDDPTTAAASTGPLPASATAAMADDHRGRGRARAHDTVGEGDSASLSPWTGVGSPSSSDFEAISDSEVCQVPLAPSSSSASSSAFPSHPPSRTREDSYSSVSSSSLPRGRRMSSSASFLAAEDESDANRRGIEGDDEDSSAFEDGGMGFGGGGGEDERGRGRGRTRRREPGPEMRRSMLEDALRSSLATLLSLAPGQPAAMSQTPSMSHASLAALWSPTASTSSSSAPTLASRGQQHPQGQRVSPFASALEDEDEEDEDEIEELDRPTISAGEDVFLSSSASSSSDEDGTQLGPTFTRSTPAPLPINITSSASQSRSRTRSCSHPESAFLPTSSSSPFTGFSPLHPSRPLGAPSSGSPPTFSRRRGAERWSGGVRRRGGGGGGGRGGRGGSNSPAPMPASVEERRRARAEAAATAGGQGGWGSASALPGAGVGEGERGRGGGEGRRGTGTDLEDGSVERDEAFAELLSAARFFSDLSPRASRTSLPSLYTSASASSATQPLFGSIRAEDGEDDQEEDEDEDDPALASESVPTLGGLSSGAEGERSPSPSPLSAEKKAVEKAAAASRPSREGEEEKPEGKKKRGGVLGWLKGLGSAVVELKVWHLVGICGLLIGVGLGAGTLIHSLATSTPLLSFLHLPPPFTASPSGAGAGSSLIKVPPRLARFNTSAASSRGEEEGMSALFC
ncbi:hypothetical protein JCM6882_006096 [Rhodosporidiobolus microsporus]